MSGAFHIPAPPSPHPQTPTNLCYLLSKGKPLCSPIPTSLPPLPHPHQTVPASPWTLLGSREGQSSLLYLPIHVKAKCSTKIHTKIEFWVFWPSFAISNSAMKCLKIRTALSVHTFPPTPRSDSIAIRPVLFNKAWTCLFSLNFKHNICFNSSNASIPPVVNNHGRQGLGKKQTKKGDFESPSSFLVFWVVFLSSGTYIPPGHLKGQKVPAISDEGPDILLGFPIGCSLMGMRKIKYLLSSIQKSQSVWLVNPWLKKVNT